MTMYKLVAIFALGAAGFVWARPKTDVLVMKNGDHLTCEIKKLERGVLYAGFDYVDGTVSIDWAKVAHAESTQLFVVQMQDGNVYQGTLRTVTAAGEQPVQIEILGETGPPEVVERRQVVEMSQTSASLWRQVSGNADVGLIYTKGNNTTQYNVGSQVRIVRTLWSAQADLNSTLSRSSGATSSTHNQLVLRALRLVGDDKWFTSSYNQFLQSSQQGIALQTSIGGGVGRLVMDSNAARISLSGGLAWQGTQYQDRSEPQSAQNALAGLIVGDMHLFRFKKTALDLTAVFAPVLTQAGRVRFNTNASYSIQIINNLWWKLSFYGNWDNRPPPNFAGSDYGTSASISYSFN